MRAAVIHETGGPEVIRIEEIADPEPAEGQVLVRVEAAGVNRFDVNQRKGGASSFPLVLGNPGDAAGTRVDTGERVVVAGAKGAYAELTVADETGVFPLPEDVEATLAAAMLTPYRTAWWGIVGRGELAEGRRLFVQGGSSSTGQAAIDIGRALGARTFESSVSALGQDGRLITPGAVGDPTVSFSVWGIVGKRGRIEGIAGQQAPREALAELLERAARGELHPWVERELPLEEAAEAHRLVEAGEVTGRIVLKPAT